MKLFATLILFASCMMVAGCGSDQPTVIGANDPEGIAAYEKMIAETTGKSSDEIKKIEQQSRGQ
ncbi:hypothetical protein [Neorhodopirellula lusitana]|uniref:hypothetical protein n=1 Tax=Neorhodopirellula lusitana TaxID=445327 RepID=UPI00384FFF1A